MKAVMREASRAGWTFALVRRTASANARVSAASATRSQRPQFGASDAAPGGLRWTHGAVAGRALNGARSYTPTPLENSDVHHQPHRSVTSREEILAISTVHA